MERVARVALKKNGLYLSRVSALLVTLLTLFFTCGPLSAADTTVEVNQHANGGTWVDLGTYYMPAGTVAFVSLSPDGVDPGGCGDNPYVTADAIKIVSVSTGDEIILDDFNGAGPGVGTVDMGTFDPYTTGGNEGTNSAWPYAPEPNAYYYHFGNNINMEATWTPDLPVAGEYTVYAHWFVGGSCRDYTAHYVIHNTTPVITASAGINGIIDPVGNTVVVEGDDQKFVITPDAGFVVETLTVDGVGVDLSTCVSGGDPCSKNGEEISYLFANVTSNHTIDATFLIDNAQTTCVEVDQTQNGRTWNYLGTHVFSAGETSFVSLQHKNEGYLTADAVKFVHVVSGDEIIIDDFNGADPVGAGTFAYTGSWSSATNYQAWPYSGTNVNRYRYTNTYASEAIWRPNFPVGGIYEVYAHWRATSSRDDHARYCINNKVGFSIIPSVEGNGIVVPGTPQVEILPGDDVSFEISSPAGNILQQLLIDGVAVDIETLEVSLGVYKYTFTDVQADHTLHATFDDHANECKGATPLTCGSTLSGVINPAGDSDYFAIELDAKADITISTSDGSATRVDTYGRLLADDCLSQLLVDNDSGSWSHFQIDSTDYQHPLPAGTYYVETTFDDSNETGLYNITLNCDKYYTVTATASHGGWIDPVGDSDIEENTSLTYQMESDNDNTIEKVVVDGVDDLTCAGLTTCTYTFNNIVENHSIHVEFEVPLTACLDISEVPMDTQVNAAPALIMFVLDDSGSMDWEVLLESGDVFDNMYYMFPLKDTNSSSTSGRGDNNDYGRIMSWERRHKWLSQFSKHNKIYFNPGTKYTPWPSYTQTGTGFFEDSNIDSPPSHPLKTRYYIDSDDIYFSTNPISGSHSATPINGDINGELGSDVNDYYSIQVNDTGTLRVTTSPSGSCVNTDTIGFVYDAEGRTVGYNDDCSEYSPSKCGCNTRGFFIETAVEPGVYFIDVGHYSATSSGNYGLSIDFIDGSNTIDNSRLSRPTATQPFDDGVSSNGSLDIIDIINAHYFTWDDANGNGSREVSEDVYLVELRDPIRYYKVDETIGLRNNYIEVGELILTDKADLPNTLIVSSDPDSADAYVEERQNFANWFTYYRRRMHTAKKAVGEMVAQIKNVKVGINTIHHRVRMTAAQIEESRSAILQNLYNLDPSGGTPLRSAVAEIGQYYHAYDNLSLSGAASDADCPYAGADEGGECQQAFAIVMTDGYYNGSYSDSRNHDNDGLLFDGSTSSWVSSVWDGSPFGDTSTSTLADIAMKYYETDLSVDLQNLVPKNKYDKATHQHMVVYGVSFGVFGTLNPRDYDEEFKLKVAPYDTIVWPSINSEPKKIDDLYHASANARGSFFSAADPQELVDSLLGIMRSIEERIGSAASVSVNADELYGKVGSDILLFQSSFNSADWSGDVKAYSLVSDENSPDYGQIDQLEWSASTNVNAVSWRNRSFITYNPDTGVGVPFRLSENVDLLSNFTVGQKEMLDADYLADSTQAEQLVNYIRGDGSNELANGGTFRTRSFKLGDFVDSSPVFEGGVVYVGGNDGALHAFDADDGHEIFAYVPNLVFDSLRYLSRQSYVHKFYVNNSVAVADITASPNKTILVGGLGRGGRGYYAIDVTGLSSDSQLATQSTSEAAAKLAEQNVAGRVMWEYPNTSTPAGELKDIGYSYSIAQIVKTASLTHPWVVLVGNGYNSESSKAKLLILDALTGQLVKSIDTNPSVTEGACNGLSTPAATDINFDDKIDYVYAGDLKGNVWKFDLTDSDLTNWRVAYEDSSLPAPFFTAKNDAGIEQPITTQPDMMFHCNKDIYQKEYPGLMVMVPTGKYLGQSDIEDKVQQSIYGLWDYGDDSSEFLGTFQRSVTTQPLSNQPGTRTGEVITLLKQEIITPSQTPGDDTYMYFDPTFEAKYPGFWMIQDTNGEKMYLRVLTDYKPTWLTEKEADPTANYNISATTCDDSKDNDGDGLYDESDECIAHAGWYFDLPLPGERIDTEVMIRGGNVIAISFIPEEGSCTAGGVSVVHEFAACSGGSTYEPTFDIPDTPGSDDNWLTPPGGSQIPPTGFFNPERLKPPPILQLDKEKEMKFFSASSGKIITVKEKAVPLGVNYWREY